MPKKQKHPNILIPDLTEQEKASFIKILSNKYGTDNFNILYSVFGDELLLFLSLFAGKTIKVPSILLLQRLKQYARVLSDYQQDQKNPQIKNKLKLKYNLPDDKLHKILSLIH